VLGPFCRPFPPLVLYWLDPSCFPRSHPSQGICIERLCTHLALQYYSYRVRCINPLSGFDY
jgi:hypothetical protein